MKLKQADENHLTRIFHVLFNDDTLILRNDLTAKDVPGWDSFNHVNLIIQIEEEFDIRFSTDEIVSLRNVGDTKELIANKIYR